MMVRSRTPHLGGKHMRLVIDNATRFFTVVGAPYMPEHHADSDAERHGRQRSSHEATRQLPSGSTGSWLNGDR
jgi:hypothetical protein